MTIRWAEEEAPAQQQSRLTALVVHHDDKARVELTKIFQGQGYTCLVDRRWTPSLAMALSQAPSLVVAGEGLPISFQGFLARTPVISISSSDSLMELKRVVESGANALITTPIDREQVLDALFQVRSLLPGESRCGFFG